MSRQSCRLKNQASVVRCPCRVNKYVGLMIFCDLCGFWQHGPCFTIIEESYLPAKHCCNNCADPPSKCTDPRICIHNSNLVQATCLYRRSLVLLNTHKGRMTPAKISRLLDVEISIGSSIIERLLSEKILLFKKSKLSYTIDKKHLLNYAFPKYLNKLPRQAPIHSNVNGTASFGTVKTASNDNSSGEDVMEINEHSLPEILENEKELKYDDIKIEAVKNEGNSPPVIPKNFETMLGSWVEIESNEKKVYDIDQEAPVKDAISISSFRKDNSGSNIPTVEKPSLPCVSENEIENKATITKIEEVKSGSETHLNVTKVNDLSQEPSVKTERK